MLTVLFLTPDIFKDFNLKVDVVCLECNHESILNFCGGKNFNLEGDFIINFIDLEFKNICWFKKNYEVNIIREIYHGILLFQKE